MPSFCFFPVRLTIQAKSTQTSGLMIIITHLFTIATFHHALLAMIAKPTRTQHPPRDWYPRWTTYAHTSDQVKHLAKSKKKNINKNQTKIKTTNEKFQLTTLEENTWNKTFSLLLFTLFLAFSGNFDQQRILKSKGFDPHQTLRFSFAPNKSKGFFKTNTCGKKLLATFCL